MFFLGSIAGLLLLLAACHALGWQIARIAPWRLRPHLRGWLAPVLGLALLLIVLVPVGWFGPGFSNWAVRSCGSAVLVAVIATVATSPRWLSSFSRIALFALLVSWPFTAQLLRFEAFDILNDPWTYCMQSQWLQQHPLIEPVPRDNLHGALSQVYFTQLTGTRAGAQFVLGAVQGMLGLERAHEAYPIALCLGFVAGALVVAFAASLTNRRRGRHAAWISGLLLGATLNGFGLGALRGYYPQTVGLPFATAGLLLCGLFAHHLPTLGLRARLGLAALIALCFAGATYAYSEILPFLALGGAAAFFLAPLLQGRLAAGLRAGLLVIVCYLVLAGAELPRAFFALIGQSKSIVGEGIPWAPGDFLRHALGGLSGYTDGATLLGPSPLLSGGLAILVALLALIGLARGRGRILLLPTAAVLGAFVVLFIHFRYRVSSPFAVGTGQSWSQYKLANWASILIFSAAALGLGELRGALRRPVLLLAVLASATGLWQAWSLADLRTARFRNEVGVERAPFATLIGMASQIARTTTPPVFLDFTASQAKSRQLFAYLLPQGTTVADWADDVFVAWMLPASERYAPRGQSRWTVRMVPGTSPQPGPCQLGLYTLAEQHCIELPLTGTRGGYPREQTAEGPLNWLRDSITYTFTIPPGTSAESITVDAEVIAIVPNLEFTLRVVRGAWSHEETISLPESHQAWLHTPHLSRTVPLGGRANEVALEIQTKAEPSIIGGNDQRELTFLLRNLHLSLTRADATSHP